MRRQPFIKILIIIVAIVCVIFLNNFIFGNFFQDLFYRVMNKPLAFIKDSSAGLSNYYSFFLKARKISEENLRLKEENNKLRGNAAEIDSLERENNVLRAELGVAARINSPLLLADIFSIQKTSLASVVLINKGKRDGVKKNLPVIASGNVLVGIVQEVFDGSSLVSLVDDPRTQVSVRVQGLNVIGNTAGELGGKMALDLITNKEEVKENDLLVTNGLDGLPESLLVGRIDNIQPSAAGLFQKIQTRGIFDMSAGSKIFVILVNH